jgi:hypothetical protein
MPRMNWLGTSEPSSDPRYPNSEPAVWLPQEQSFHAAVTRAKGQCDAALAPSAQGELRPCERFHFVATVFTGSDV